MELAERAAKAASKPLERQKESSGNLLAAAGTSDATRATGDVTGGGSSSSKPGTATSARASDTLDAPVHSTDEPDRATPFKFDPSMMYEQHVEFGLSQLRHALHPSSDSTPRTASVEDYRPPASAGSLDSPVVHSPLGGRLAMMQGKQEGEIKIAAEMLFSSAMLTNIRRRARFVQRSPE